ncbi:MAG TPA: BON domain-containing protein [Candidatus Binataceae bacterium]|nr:BON domain-containing protein [Candidatus Binataceae bacterium]
MKKCPSCDRTYPDSETFCETDGTALVGADPAFVHGGAGGAECPVCGGKAEPGEVICNFCGARLSQDTPSSPPPRKSRPSEPARPAAQRPSPGRDRTMVSSPLSGQFTARMPEQAPDQEDATGGVGGILRLIAYIAAALIALIGGAWLAIHLTAHHRAAQPQSSPSAASASSAATAPAPMVALANSIPIKVTGESASAPERSTTVAGTTFDSGKPALLDAYSHAIAADPNAKDGMLVRIRILPDGTISKASVQTSTAPNPGLDAEVIGDMSAWSFAPFGGGQVEISYPIIFAQTAADQAALESQLSAKLASLSPAEAPEYSSATSSPAATPIATAAPSAAPSPEVRKPHRHEAVTPRPRPAPPSLYDRVNSALKGNRKLGGAKAYTSSGGTVTLTGRVFDDNDKALAERTVRSVSGVTNVVDTLTTDTGEWARQQATIQQQLANAGLPKVTVKVIGKDAYLNGTVTTNLDKQRAVTITEGAAPVVVRGNVITVVPGNMFGF